MKTTIHADKNGNRVKFITNGIARRFLYWYELNDAEKAEFDYLETEDEQNDATFFRYKDSVYSLDGFMHSSGFAGYDASAADTFFSGIAIKIVNGGASVIVARYYAMSAE